jgi:hypothetical protein
MEPDKCKEWRWFSWEDVTRMAQVQMGVREAEKGENDKLFTPIVNFVKDYPNLGPA